MFKGLPETVTAEREHGAEVHGAVEGGIFGLLKGSTGADYRYLRSENETRSLHHHVYSQLEDRLIESDRVLAIDGDFDVSRWEPHAFRDGRFILVTGRVRLLDYAWASDTIEAFPKLTKAVAELQKLHFRELKRTGAMAQAAIDKQMAELDGTVRDTEKLKLDRVGEVMRALYGEMVRLKVVPVASSLSHVIVGTCRPDCFQDPVAAVSQKYGCDIDAQWRVLAQVNASDGDDAPQPLPVGNLIDDQIETVFTAMNEMLSIATAVTFPAISCTPISIYRSA